MKTWWHYNGWVIVIPMFALIITSILVGVFALLIWAFA